MSRFPARSRQTAPRASSLVMAGLVSICRTLRRQSIAVRETADVIIASFWIDHGHSLVFADRDFLPSAEKLKLERA